MLIRTNSDTPTAAAVPAALLMSLRCDVTAPSRSRQPGRRQYRRSAPLADHKDGSTKCPVGHAVLADPGGMAQKLHLAI